MTNQYCVLHRALLFLCHLGTSLRHNLQSGYVSNQAHTLQEVHQHLASRDCPSLGRAKPIRHPALVIGHFCHATGLSTVSSAVLESLL